TSVNTVNPVGTTTSAPTPRAQSRSTAARVTSAPSRSRATGAARSGRKASTCTPAGRNTSAGRPIAGSLSSYSSPSSDGRSATQPLDLLPLLDRADHDGRDTAQILRVVDERWHCELAGLPVVAKQRDGKRAALMVLLEGAVTP